MPRAAWLVVGFSFLGAAFAPFALKLVAGAAAQAPSGGRVQLPVGSVCGAAWDVEEEVALVALCEFARVQAYDSSGRFQFGWSVPASGGAFQLSRLAEGRYVLDIVRGRRRQVVNAHGAAPLKLDDLGAPKAPPEDSRPLAKPRLLTDESPMGDKVLMEWPNRRVQVGGSWLAPFVASNFVSIGLGVLGVFCLETWRRRR